MEQHSKLRSAIQNNKYKKVVALIKAGVDVNAKYNIDDDTTPLSTAIVKNNARIVEVLLQNGADTEMTSHDSLHPIHLATFLDQLEIVKLLVKYGARVDSRSALNGECAVHVAAHDGFVHIIDYFLDIGVDIDLSCFQGCTPLQRAANSYEERLRYYDNGSYNQCILLRSVASYHHVIRYLVEKGANIFRKNNNGETALHICARHRYADGIKILIEKGASVLVKNNSGRSPMDEFFQGYIESTSGNFAYTRPSAQILIKYMLLQSNKSFKQHNIRDIFPDPNYPAKHPYTQELTIFLASCKTEIEKMKTFIIENTTISVHKFLHDIFDDSRLLTHLGNENVRKELKNIKYFLNEFPIYSSVNITVKDKVKYLRKRLDLVNRACETMDNKITPLLPSQIKHNIFSYLSDLNLIDFANAINGCEIDDNSDLNALKIENNKKATKSYASKNKLSAFMNRIFKK